jgi:hypothetical protein
MAKTATKAILSFSFHSVYVRPGPPLLAPRITIAREFLKSVHRVFSNGEDRWNAKFSLVVVKWADEHFINDKFHSEHLLHPASRDNV